MWKQRLISIISMGLLTSIMGAGSLCMAIEPSETTIEAREFTGKNGEKLLYRVLRPGNYDPDVKYPLVLCLHGGGGRGNDNKSRGTQAFIALSDPEVQKNYPAFLVTPQCPREGSWAPRDPNRNYSVTKLPMTREAILVLEILDSLQEEFSIDPARLYVSGQSMGGRGTWEMILRNPNLFAAAVPVCGVGDPAEAKRIVHMPIWNFHGGKDGVVPVQASRDMVAALKKLGSKVIYSELEGVNHGSWEPAWETKELVPWLFKQRNPNPGKAQFSIKTRQQAQRQGQRRREPRARRPGGRRQAGNIGQEGWTWENSVPNISGGTVQYSLLSPPRLEPDTIYPVILSLHGGGGSHLGGGGSWTRRQYYNDYRQQYPAYVVCPNSHHSTGVYATIIGVIESLPQVDLDRVYVMGHSYGGEGTTKVIGEFPNVFAAASPCAGGGLTRAGRTPFDAESVKHLPIWAFHGSIDAVCSYQFMKDNFNDAAAVGGNFKLTTWVGANHNVPDLFFVYDGGDSSIEGALGKFEAINECSTPGVCDEEMVYVKWLFKQNRKNQNPKAERQGQRRKEPGARGPGGREQGKYFGREGWDFEKTMEDPLGGDGRWCMNHVTS